MEKSRKLGLTANELKYIAILAMLVDHTAHLFIPCDTVLYQCMRGFGRITAPIMCFFITEGYHYTHNLRKYFVRLIVFAFISHFAFAFCFAGSFFANYHESMIATLTLSLFAVHVVNTDKIKKEYKLPVILLITVLAEKCDWGSTAIWFTLAFELSRGNRKAQYISYAMVLFTMKLLSKLHLFFTSNELFRDSIFVFGGLAVVPLLMAYNGEKGGSKFSKWFFYIFYPLHLILLGYINIKYS